MLKRGYTESECDKWMRNFDDNQDGKITISEFLDRLDANDEFYEKPTQHSADIEILNASSTTFHRQYVIINVVRRAMEKLENDKKEAAKLIKTQLDSQLDKLWHCVMLKGQYWAFYSHEPENSLVFKYKNTVFILFRTPSM